MSGLVKTSERFFRSQLKPWEGDASAGENFITASTPYWGYKEYASQQEERQTRIAGEEAVVAKGKADAAAKVIADAEANAAADAKAVSDKAAADQAIADKAAADLAARRRGASPYVTGKQGLLGTAPVKLKSLLGA